MSKLRQRFRLGISLKKLFQGQHFADSHFFIIKGQDCDIAKQKSSNLRLSQKTWTNRSSILLQGLQI